MSEIKHLSSAGGSDQWTHSPHRVTWLPAMPLVNWEGYLGGGDYNRPATLYFCPPERQNNWSPLYVCISPRVSNLKVVSLSVCLFVFLFVCVLARLLKKLWINCSEISWRESRVVKGASGQILVVIQIAMLNLIRNPAITQQSMNGFWWNFHDGSAMIQGTIGYILGWSRSPCWLSKSGIRTLLKQTMRAKAASRREFPSNFNLPR